MTSISASEEVSGSETRAERGNVILIVVGIFLLLFFRLLPGLFGKRGEGFPGLGEPATFLTATMHFPVIYLNEAVLLVR